jgi:hypothetical protein
MKSLAKVLIALAPVLVLGQCTLEFLAIDRCLDQGKVYDYAQGLCRSDVLTSPHVAYLERSWPWLVTALAGFVLGVVLYFSAGRKPS